MTRSERCPRGNTPERINEAFDRVVSADARYRFVIDAVPLRG